MTGERPYSRADYLAIKAAVRRALESAGTLVEVASQTRVDPAQLSRYGNPESSHFVPLDVAMDLDHLAGAPVILRAFAERSGFELVARDAKPAAAPDLVQRIASITTESADVVRAIAETANQAMTPAQARTIEHEATEAIDALETVRNDARQVIAASGTARKV